MRLPAQTVKAVQVAALLHDIGKINVPAELLAKPGRLNDIEFALIKCHPQMGYEILKQIPFDWPVADIVLQHHERLDGSGYPQGINGQQICLEARIIAVADVVEAMSAHRPYRAALGWEMAAQEIIDNKDICYDCEVVEACLQVQNSIDPVDSSYCSSAL